MTAVTLSEIARLANVQVSAVSNWKFRDRSFPEPIDAEGKYFDLDAVAAWADQEGRPVRISGTDRIWYDYLGNERRSTTALADILEQLYPGPMTDPALHELAKGESSNALIESFVAKTSLGTGIEPAEYLRDISVAVRSNRPADVYDPAAGTGELLLALAGALHVGRVVAVTSSEDDSIIALARLQAAFPEQSVAVRSVDPFAEPVGEERFDLVVCDAYSAARSQSTPQLDVGDVRSRFGRPPKSEPELTWLVHCLTVTAANGHAVIRMPNAAAHRKTGRRIRSELLRQGLLRAVVANPDGRTQTWVLDGENHGAADRRLMVSEFDSFARKWNAGDGEVAGAASVPVIELLDQSVDLSPNLHLGPGHATESDFRDGVHALRRRLRGITSTLPEWDFESSAQYPLVSLGALDKAGEISISTAREGHGVVLDHRHLRVVTVGDVPESEALYWLVEASDEWDPHYLAAGIHSGVRDMSTAVTGEAKRRVMGIRVPRLPVEEQRRRGAAFRVVWELNQELEAARREGRDVMFDAAQVLMENRVTGEVDSSGRHGCT